MTHAPADLTTFARRFGAIGTEPRLRILGLLVSAGVHGLVVGEIARELGIGGSTLSHHLEKLRQEGLVRVRREGTFLRYSVDAEALEELLAFLTTQLRATAGVEGARIAAEGLQ